MRIDKIAENTGCLKQTDATRPGKGGEDFTRLLNEELDHSKPSFSPVADALDPLLLDASLRIPSAGISCYPSADAGLIENELSTTIDRLERIEQQLRDDGIPPRDIEHALTALKAESLALLQRAEALPPSHPLRRIAEDLSVLTSVESLKWKRGDYL